MARDAGERGETDFGERYYSAAGMKSTQSGREQKHFSWMNLVKSDLTIRYENK